MRLSLSLWAALVLPMNVAVAAPFAHEAGNEDNLLKTIYQFPNETWVENIAVRSNGNLLVTIINRPEIWEVNPGRQTADLIYTFPHVGSACGIAEVSPDVFAVATGNWSDVTFDATPGSWSAWTVDLRERRHARVHKITDLPEASFLNGMTSLPTQVSTVLLGDSGKGVIYALNTTSGEYHIVLDEPQFKPNTSIPFVLGLNGIRLHENTLYFVNSFASPTLAYLPINPYGTAAGPVTDILDASNFPTNLGYHGDDFTIDPVSGDFWLNTDSSNTLLRVTPQGTYSVVAGGINSPVIAGDTSSAFGRTDRDARTLYIVTNGGIIAPPASGIVGGKVLAVDTNRGVSIHGDETSQPMKPNVPMSGPEVAR